MSRIIDFDNITINKEYILARISEAEIFEHYLKHSYQLGKLYKSPLRDNDSTPSFNIYRLHNELRYKDFGYTGGNCFEFVRNLYNCDYRTCLQIIINDFKLVKESKIQVLNSRATNPVIEELEKFQKKIVPVKRPWKKLDYDYWNRYYIPLLNLNKEKIYPCNYIYLQSNPENMFIWGEHVDKNPIYCFDFGSKYKVYRPLSTDKKSKWISTAGMYDIQGMATLPKRGELLIITSSMKDLLVLKVLGYNAIAPQGESTGIPAKIMDYLWACFDNIVVMYDNDEAGVTSMEKFVIENPGVSPIFLPKDAEKDISDNIELYGVEDTRELMKRLV